MLDAMALADEHLVADAVDPVFARHETFPPRYGWLKKAYDAAREEPEVFLKDDAPIRLGVGKNMVRAMRYWAEAFKVLDRQPNPTRPRLHDAVPTPFGDALLGEGGWDPYLESQSSLWLLHWKLCEPPCIAPSWYFVFASGGAGITSADGLLAQVQARCAERAEWGDVAANSLRKDTRCLLRMYASVTKGRDLPEDTIDSPFAELNLLRALPGAERLLTFVEGGKSGLADAILAYASLRFAARQREGLIPLSRLAHEPGSPGIVFRLGQEDLTDGLEPVAERADGFVVTTSASAPVLVYSGELERSAETLLDDFYAGALVGT